MTNQLYPGMTGLVLYLADHPAPTHLRADETIYIHSHSRQRRILGRYLADGRGRLARTTPQYRNRDYDQVKFSKYLQHY